MTALLQLSCNVGIKAVLYDKFFILHPLPAGCIQCLLWIQMEINHIHNHLHMSLGLHIAAHDAEWTNCFSIPCKKSGNDGMVGTLSGNKSIDMITIQREIMSAVLKGDSCVLYYNPTAKAHIIALNEGYHISFAVCCT